MKPTLALTDYNILRRLLTFAPPVHSTKEATQLREELNKATVLEDHRLGEKVVRLNSQVEIQDVKSGNTTNLRIVLPAHANLKERKLSVFAPISIALLGFKEGDSFEWEMPGGRKRIRILGVENDEPDLAV